MVILIAICLNGTRDLSAIYNSFSTLIDVVENMKEDEYSVQLNCTCEELESLIEAHKKLQSEGDFTVNEATINLADYLCYLEMNKLAKHVSSDVDLLRISNVDVAIAILNSQYLDQKEILRLSHQLPHVTSDERVRSIFRLSEELPNISARVFQEDYSKTFSIKTSNPFIAGGVIRAVLKNGDVVLQAGDKIFLRTQDKSVVLKTVNSICQVTTFDGSISIVENKITYIFTCDGAKIYETADKVLVRNGCILVPHDKNTEIFAIPPVSPSKNIPRKITTAGKYYCACPDNTVRSLSNGESLNVGSCDEIIYCESYDIDLIVCRLSCNISIYSIDGKKLFVGSPNTSNWNNCMILDTYIFYATWMTYTCIHWPSDEVIFTDRHISESLINDRLLFN